MAKVLIVEDDLALGEIYMTRLIAEGFEVKLVHDGELALSSAVEYEPDLVLLDIMMPRISGFDVLDILRNTPKTKDYKIVVISALSEQDKIEQAKALGSDDYLIKSKTTVADLVEKVKQAVASDKK